MLRIPSSLLRVFLGVLIAGVVMALIVPIIGSATPQWLVWLVLAGCIATALALPIRSRD